MPAGSERERGMSIKKRAIPIGICISYIHTVASPDFVIKIIPPAKNEIIKSQEKFPPTRNEIWGFLVC